MKYSEYNGLCDLSSANLTPKQAILMKCKECCAFQNNEVRLCNSKDCALWEISRKYLTHSSRPNRVMSEEQREASRIRMKEFRAKALSNEA